jgi:hypothetical protein
VFLAVLMFGAAVLMERKCRGPARAAPDDQQRGAGQRYQSMLEWWSREKQPPSFRSNVYSCITSELATMRPKT